MRRLPMLGLLALLASCASTARSGAIAPSSPFTPELARVFDDAVDYVENVEDLGGRVATEWRRQIDGLSQNSDLIAVVRVETVTTGSDAAGTQAWRLSTVARSAVRGDLPPDHRVELHVSEGAVGFNTVRGNESRLQSRDYVLFAKWYQDEAGQVRAHWHLSPSSPSLLQRVRDSLSLGGPATESGQSRVLRNQ